MEPIRYSIGVASRLTGLPLETLRAWERRYGVVVPRREGRVRTYGETDVQKLRLLRELVSAGHGIGRLARLSDAELRALRDADASAGGAPLPSPEPRLARLWDAVERFDRAALHAELDRLATLLPAETTCLEVAVPLLRQVGNAWADGRIGVAHEHLVSAAVRTLLGSLLRLQASTGADVVFAAPEGELHELGLLAGALLGAAAGVSPVYLGPNVPTADVVDAVRRSHARAVVLAVTTERAEPDPVQAVRTIAKRVGPRVEVLVGGARTEAMIESLRAGPARWLGDLEGLAKELRRIAGRRG